jgi:hypothetical protein
VRRKNTKIDFKEIGYEVVDWIKLAQSMFYAEFS